MADPFDPKGADPNQKARKLRKDILGKPTTSPSTTATTAGTPPDPAPPLAEQAGRATGLAARRAGRFAAEGAGHIAGFADRRVGDVLAAEKAINPIRPAIKYGGQFLEGVAEALPAQNSPTSILRPLPSHQDNSRALPSHSQDPADRWEEHTKIRRDFVAGLQQPDTEQKSALSAPDTLPDSTRSRLKDPIRPQRLQRPQETISLAPSGEGLSLRDRAMKEMGISDYANADRNALRQKVIALAMGDDRQQIADWNQQQGYAESPLVEKNPYYFNNSPTAIIDGQRMSGDTANRINSALYQGPDSISADETYSVFRAGKGAVGSEPVYEYVPPKKGKSGRTLVPGYNRVARMTEPQAAVPDSTQHYSFKDPTTPFATEREAQAGTSDAERAVQSDIDLQGAKTQQAKAAASRDFATAKAVKKGNLSPAGSSQTTGKGTLKFIKVPDPTSADPYAEVTKAAVIDTKGNLVRFLTPEEEVAFQRKKAIAEEYLTNNPSAHNDPAVQEVLQGHGIVPGQGTGNSSLDDVMAEAESAINNGADRGKVLERLRRFYAGQKGALSIVEKHFGQ